MTSSAGWWCTWVMSAQQAPAYLGFACPCILFIRELNQLCQLTYLHLCVDHRFVLSSLFVLPKVHVEAKVLTLGNLLNPFPQTHACTHKHKHRSRLCQLSLVQIHIQSASRGLSRNVLHVQTARWHREREREIENRRLHRKVGKWERRVIKGT